jgi:hypothetical protein
MKLIVALLLVASASYGQIANPTTASSLGLGSTDSVSFSNVTLGNFAAGSDKGFAGQSSAKLLVMYGTNVTTSVPAFYGWSGFANTAMDAGTARTNLALGAANNVTFSNVTASGTLTATGNVTLNGTDNLAPSQTTNSASSLMTRSLSDARYLPQFGEFLNGKYFHTHATDWMTTRVTNGGTATFEGLYPRWVVGSATNINGVGAVRLGFVNNYDNQSSTGGNRMWSDPFTAYVNIAFSGDSNSITRFVVGERTTSVIGAYPTNRAIGFEVTHVGDANSAQVIRLFAHNGTTATNGPWVTNFSTFGFTDTALYAVSHNTNGSVQLFRSIKRGAFTNVSSANITGGPTNNSGGNLYGVADLAMETTNTTAFGGNFRMYRWGYKYD